MDLLLLIIGVILLSIGGDKAVKSSVDLSFKLKLSKIIVGITVLSFVTSAPELFVSLYSAFTGSQEISLGNLLGSNITNVTLILGITAIVTPIALNKFVFVQVIRSWVVMMIFSFILYITIHNGELSRVEGFSLFFTLIFYILYEVRSKKKKNLNQTTNVIILKKYHLILMNLLFSIMLLFLGSKLIVTGSVNLSNYYGISKSVFGVSIVALATSLPELSASIIASRKGENEISIGNIIGSNIFNIGSVLGLTAMIKPLKVEPVFINNDVFWLIGSSLILLPLIYVFEKYILSRVKGVVLVLIYLIFLFYIFTK